MERNQVLKLVCPIFSLIISRAEAQVFSKEVSITIGTSAFKVIFVDKGSIYTQDLYFTVNLKKNQGKLQ
jgi:hypothetical protein